jgi:hypothetical protein
MALSLVNALEVREKTRFESRNPGVAEAMRGLFKHINQIGNPDLYLEEFSGLETADQVIADVGCTLYCVYFKKPTASTTDAWIKGSNHATVAAANGDIVAYLRGTSGGGRQYAMTFHDGLLLGTGLTLGCHTTVSGNTKSAAADAATGFAIIGAL